LAPVPNGPGSSRRAGSRASPERVVAISVDHLVIAISDWDRSNAFYRDVVGAEVIDYGNGRFA
jgi:hypothetical protein